MCTFKVGDVVRILGGTTSIPEIAETIGKTGVIIDISRDVAKVSFVSDFWYYNFDEIEHCTKSEPYVPHKCDGSGDTITCGNCGEYYCICCGCDCSNPDERMLEKLGIQIYNENGEFRNFIDIINEISKLPDVKPNIDIDTIIKTAVKARQEEE